MTRVLILGSGAREHALAWRLAQDSECELLCAPGNPGMAAICSTSDCDLRSVESMTAFAQSHKADFVIVGPEGPLCVGVVDALQQFNIPAFGPTQNAAQLEGSKGFAKAFMKRHGIPTASFDVFEDPELALKHIELSPSAAMVIKADGLAAGKGVVVAMSKTEARDAIDLIMKRQAYGEAGCRVVIEEFLSGQEVSYHVVTDGTRYTVLPSAQDHKRAFDDDLGPNTGGMGAYAYPPIFTEAMDEQVRKVIVEPTLRGLRADGIAFRGVLFIGLMIVNGAPYVLEYNVRFGDPETTAILPLVQGDLLKLLMRAATSEIQGDEVSNAQQASISVVVTSGGYPQAFQTGYEITGLDVLRDDVQVFHAGTKRTAKGIVTAGGRVLTVNAVGRTITAASRRVYEEIENIAFEGMHYRKDIARPRTNRS